MSAQTHYRACNLCEAMCGLRIEAENGHVTSIRGDDDDPLSRGYLCPKAFALKDLHEDPDRLRHPIRRTKSGWERLAWDDALDLASHGLVDVQKAHGNDAVGVYLGNPNVHNTGSKTLDVNAVYAAGMRLRGQYRGADGGIALCA